MGFNVLHLFYYLILIIASSDTAINASRILDKERGDQGLAKQSQRRDVTSSFIDSHHVKAPPSRLTFRSY